VGPGEIARAHRHTPAALRMIVESTGGYTVVNGDVVRMLDGDLVLMPNWTWHDPTAELLLCPSAEEWRRWDEAKARGRGLRPGLSLRTSTFD
jgi:hypothetical protein